MTATKKKVWKGADGLKRLLVPIDSLEPFPGNARRGDVAALRGSLHRFGQVLPVLADPALGADGRQRIVARHHLVIAASTMSELQIEGVEDWTHIAVLAHAFENEEEARAYNVADNRLPELGGYDDEALVAQLRALRELDALDGTGYADPDVDAALARLAAADPVIKATGQRTHTDPGMKELVLVYNEEQLAQIEVWLGIVAKEKGSSGTSETVYEGLRVAAAELNA